MQRLTVGACVAIRMHSEAGNIQQLRHDLRNGPTVCLVTTVNATLHFESLD